MFATASDHDYPLYLFRVNKFTRIRPELQFQPIVNLGKGTFRGGQLGI